MPTPPPYSVACYSSASTLFASGFSLESQQGEHQGCPLGPLFFSVASVHHAKICNNSDCWSHWYLDDGHVVGRRSLVADLLPLLEREALQIGLVLNRSKCSVFSPSGRDLPEDTFPGVPTISPDSCVRVLGSPIGAQSACQAWIGDNVITPLSRALTQLECLGDPHSASLVLRNCLSGAKVNWTLRTADPISSAWAAAQVAPLLRHTWGVIIGTPTTDAQIGRASCRERVCLYV